jgi:hypothetical protein
MYCTAEAQLELVLLPMLSATLDVNDLSIHWEVAEFVLSSTVMMSRSVPEQHEVPLKELEYITLKVDGDTFSSLTFTVGMHCL